MKKISVLFAFLAIFCLKSCTTFKGIVTDAAGNPVQGAEVLVNCSDRGAITDSEGRFKLRTFSSYDSCFVTVFKDTQMAAKKVKRNKVARIDLAGNEFYK